MGSSIACVKWGSAGSPVTHTRRGSPVPLLVQDGELLCCSRSEKHDRPSANHDSRASVVSLWRVIEDTGPVAENPHCASP